MDFYELKNLKIYIYGFSSTENSIVFYNQNNRILDKIFEKPGSTLKYFIQVLKAKKPNILFYLIPFKILYSHISQMESIKKLIDTCEKKIRDKLGYITKFFGYKGLDRIYMNDINSERKIKNFEHYKIMKIFKINNKKIEKIKCEEIVIRTYIINFIEVKSSFNNLEKDNKL